MNERDQEMRDPNTEMREPNTDSDPASYEAQAGSSAPVAPTRDRQETESQESNGDRQSIDQRASSTETQPMAGRDDAQTGADGSRLIHDQKWQYFAGRWDAIQAGFVDDPRRTVEQADRLVAEVIDHLSTMFKDERAKLEGQWSRSGKADTEDLRIAMQRYRDFFRTLVGR